MADYRGGRHAARLCALQKDDGGWGCFHTLRAQSGDVITTEAALGRLERLGFTEKDGCIQRALSHMERLLQTGQLPEGREKGCDFEVFTDLIVATRIRRFTHFSEAANAVARRWAQIIEMAFQSGGYEAADYCAAYEAAFRRAPRGGRLADFVNFYPLSLVRGFLTPETQRRMVDYVLRYEGGVYYVYEHRLDALPGEFSGRTVSRYLAAVELLSDYEVEGKAFDFVRVWLEEHRQEDGSWDLGPSARDGVYFPLSDRWDQASRRTDCTRRIQQLLARIG